MGPPISLSQTPSYASSNTSIAESESKFNTKTVLLDEIQLLENDKTTKRNKLLNEWLILNFQVRKYMKHRTKRATPTEFYDQDEDNKDDDDNDDDDDDDNSSQFSFCTI